MALSMWTNMITGQRLDDDELHRFREHAHRLYEANTHIFEDELDALSALGVEALCERPRPVPVTGRPLAAA